MVSTPISCPVDTSSKMAIAIELHSHRRVNSGRVRCLELELEGELDGAGAADLVEGVEACVLPASQAAG
jgi:hypothetical protein